MALVVQQDTPIEGANGYVSDVWVADYLADRGTTLSPGDTLQQAIVRATDYIDQRFNFIGERILLDQATAWPRCNAINFYGYFIKGVPLAIKRATAEYAAIAMSAELNPTPERDDTGQKVILKSESIGPLSETVEYSEVGSVSLPSYPKADGFIAKAGLLVGAGRVFRG